MTISHFSKEVFKPYTCDCHAPGCDVKIQPGHNYISDAGSPFNFYCSWDCSEKQVLDFPDELKYEAPLEHCGATGGLKVLIGGVEYYRILGTSILCCSEPCATKEFNHQSAPYENDRANQILELAADLDYQKQKGDRWK